MKARHLIVTPIYVTALIFGLTVPVAAQETATTGSAADDVVEKRTAAKREASARKPAGNDAAMLPNELPEGVLAVVNGRPIAELALENVVRQLGADGEQPDRTRILDELIDLEILTQEAEKLDLGNKPDISAALQLQYIQTMANAYLAETGDAMAFSDEELRAEYDRQTKNLDAEEYRASHILAETRADAQALIDELSDGADFATLAKERSTDPAGANGGDLGWFAPGSMVPEFTEAVEKLVVGEYSKEPVETDFGFHVIQLVDKRGASLPDYNTVKPGLTNILLRDRLAAKVEALRESADINR